MTEMPLIEKIGELDDRYCIFADRVRDPLSQDHKFKFNFSAKDNLCSREFQARAGSKILNGYRPPFDATPIERLRDAGGFLVGKTNMDEFGFGTFSTNSGFGVPKNPFDVDRSCGGSSGGAAAAACLIPGHIALGVSTGGSISCPASFCGVVGLTPTYGRVSRWGLIDYGNSLDKVGLLSRSVHDVKHFFPVISGPDKRDPTSCIQPPLEVDLDVRTIAIPKEALNDLSPEVAASFSSAVERMRSTGMEIKEVSMPSLRFALPAYYVLATSEASTNLARYCGMRFGVMNENTDRHFNEFFTETRSACFGNEAKRRILLGTYSRMVGFRNRYYMKALQTRQLIIHEYENVFRENDLIMTPTMPFISPKFSEIAKMRPLEMYQADFLTVPPNLAGVPHISIPCGYHEGMPIGLQFIAPHWKEGGLLRAAEIWEKDFKFRYPEGSS